MPGVGVIPWSPLARGFLGRSHAQAQDKQTTRAKSDNILDMQFDANDMETLRRVEETAKKHGRNNAQIATAWLLAKGITAPIVGASKMSHLDDAIAAAEIRLTAEEVAYLDEPYKAKPVAGNCVKLLCHGRPPSRPSMPQPRKILKWLAVESLRLHCDARP